MVSLGSVLLIYPGDKRVGFRFRAEESTCKSIRKTCLYISNYPFGCVFLSCGLNPNKITDVI